ncbi:MAG: hypothetical protein CFE21_05150 [Bacteroidetes bacterium B1(2017)]|nr:MAG: hypothetical protein CFE21_05150 [Bacteroidetes bacterium B1(2017)]
MDLIGEADHASLPLPNRSVTILDENGVLKYLNIPAQIIHTPNFNPNVNTIYSLQNCTITKTALY